MEVPPSCISRPRQWASLGHPPPGQPDTKAAAWSFRPVRLRRLRRQARFPVAGRGACDLRRPPSRPGCRRLDACGSSPRGAGGDRLRL